MAKGDEQAFSAFIYQHTDSIYSYVLRITRSEQWAEEIVQDIWLQVWMAREYIAGLDNPMGYLYKMAQNRSLDWIRRNKRELQLQYQLGQHLTPVSYDPASEKAGADKISQLLTKGIQELPPQRKQVFELRLAGLNYEQIAAEMGISKNTVRNQVVSALASLRELLRKNGELSVLIFFYFFSE